VLPGPNSRGLSPAWPLLKEDRRIEK